MGKLKTKTLFNRYIDLNFTCFSINSKCIVDGINMTDNYIQFFPLPNESIHNFIGNCDKIWLSTGKSSV
jgi:hypothetical protein